MSELLPCPFCGGKAVDDTHSRRTGCPSCRIWVHRTTITTEGGIGRSVERESAAWNARADVAQAMVAAAYDAAARAAFRAGKSVHSGYRDENERLAQRIENELRLEVQKAIRQRANTEARAALNAMLAKAREDALREAAQIAIDYGEQQYSANVANHPQYADDAQEDGQEIARQILSLIPTAEGKA